jgi:hypothetical protein
VIVLCFHLTATGIWVRDYKKCCCRGRGPRAAAAAKVSGCTPRPLTGDKTHTWAKAPAKVATGARTLLRLVLHSVLVGLCGYGRRSRGKLFELSFLNMGSVDLGVFRKLFFASGHRPDSRQGCIRAANSACLNAPNRVHSAKAMSTASCGLTHENVVISSGVTISSNGSALQFGKSENGHFPVASWLRAFNTSARPCFPKPCRTFPANLNLPPSNWPSASIPFTSRASAAGHGSRCR